MVPGGTSRSSWRAARRTVAALFATVIFAITGLFATGHASAKASQLVVVGAYVLVAVVAASAALRYPRRSSTDENSAARVSQLREGPIEEPDLGLIEEYISGSTVLVTGSAGSIGSALCRALVTCRPSELVGVDLRPTNHVALDGIADGVAVRSLIADIRDGDQMNAIFAAKRPEVVIHCAGIEGLARVDGNPIEAWRTNVFGTNVVLRAAATYGVGSFINLSSTNVATGQGALACTHRIAERLTSWYANRIRGQWVSVRFGPTAGQDDGIAHLILEAGALGGRGEALVLDVDLPAQGIADDEPELIRVHPKIAHVLVPPLRPTHLGLFDDSSYDSAMASMIHIGASGREGSEPFSTPASHQRSQ